MEQNYLEETQLFFLLERVININGADSQYTNIQSKMGVSQTKRFNTIGANK